MKMKTHFIAILMLALAVFAAHADEKTDALIKAAKNDDIAEARRLIADGADVNAKDGKGMTALMWAKSADVAKLLLEAGANVDAKDYAFGRTALMYAARANSADVAKLLIAAGADVEAKENDGETALMNAARSNSADAARLLLAAGADVNAEAKDGRTALMLAAERNSSDMAIQADGHDWSKGYAQKCQLLRAQYFSGEITRTQFFTNMCSVYDEWLEKNPDDALHLVPYAVLLFLAGDEEKSISMMERVYDCNHDYDFENPSISDVHNFFAGVAAGKIRREDFSGKAYEFLFDVTEEDLITIFVGN